jgi:hypothetical protein
VEAQGINGQGLAAVLESSVVSESSAVSESSLIKEF